MSVEALVFLLESLLGREATKEEYDLFVAKSQMSGFTGEVAANELMATMEFHLRHREAMAQQLFPRPTIVFARGPLGHEIVVDLRQFHVGFSMAQGHYEPRETAFVLRHVKRGMTVLDAGANVGYFTTIFAGLVGDGGTVIALEPVSDTRRKLKAAVSRNKLENIVEIVALAVSSGVGEVQVSYPIASTNMGGVHISPIGAASHEICEVVKTSTIDRIVSGRPVHFIKIDIEGAEGLALKGAEQTIVKNRPLMMVEFNVDFLQSVSGVSPAELHAKILNWGYEPFGIGHDGDLIAPPAVESMINGSVHNLVFAPLSM